jgi:hypothetical protein
MLESFKRMFAKAPAPRDFSEVSAWALRHGHGFKRVRGQDGFAIEGLLDGRPWRAEWGPPQRHYIEGHELRLRMELDLSPDLQMLLMSRPLLESLDRETFEEFTDSVQTLIGTQTPEEMRWLVMFPKLDLGESRTLRTQFGGVASVPAAGSAWISGALGRQLEEAAYGFLNAQPPFLLMTLRGRVYLRLQLANPQPSDVAAALALFETAVAQALAAASSVNLRANSGWGSTGNTAWQSLEAGGDLQDGHGARKR